jgi:hypothetical protein
MRRWMWSWVALISIACCAAPALAWVNEGQVAPAFTKNTLAGGPPWSVGPPVSLSSYSGKVLVIFLMGCT